MYIIIKNKHFFFYKYIILTHFLHRHENVK